MSEDGETVYLSSADAAGNLTGFFTAQKFTSSETNVSQGRVPVHNARDFAALTGHTFGVSAPADRTEFRTGTGALNAAPRVGPVVISEICYQPPAGGAEFIEVMNVHSASAALDGWILEGAGGFVFPVATTLAPGGLAVVADVTDAAAFRAARGIPATVAVFAHTFDIGDAGEQVDLLKPNTDPLRPAIRVDRVRFNDKAPWPTEAAGRGYALERLSRTAFGNDPLNWHCGAAGGSPGFYNPPAASVAIARGSEWKMHTSGRNLGTAWQALDYADTVWIGAAAPMGFGTAGLNTTLPYPTPPRPLTTWLRKEFAIAADSSAIQSVSLEVNFNDGFVAWLNGSEVARRSLRGGTVSYLTTAWPHAHGTFETIDLSAFKSLLVPGRNLLAVELHLTDNADPDAYWDASLTYLRAPAIADTDGDGMPDSWEIANALNPGDPADASADPDGDGADNLFEYLVGTLPHDPGSVLHLRATGHTAAGQFLRFSSVNSRTYAMEYSDNLSIWNPLGPSITGTGFEIETLDAAASPGRKWHYRLRFVP